MELVKNILIGIYVIISLALIVLTVSQTKDDPGMSGALAGSSTNNFFEKNKARTKEGIQKRATIGLGVTFAMLTIGLSVLYVI